MKKRRVRTFAYDIKNYIVIIALVMFEFGFIIQGSDNSVYACCDEKTSNANIVLNVQSKEVSAFDQNAVIVIDPGHGGYDGGSLGNGFIEKDLTLEISKRVGDILKKRSITVIYTRNDDEWYWTEDNEEDLAYRVSIAKQQKANLFLSIHLNSSDPGISGLEVWTSFNKPSSYQFAQNIQMQLTRLAYTEDRGLKNQDDNSLYVLENNDVPSALVELGFITSSNDIDYITSEDGKEAIANAIADGVMETIMK